MQTTLRTGDGTQVEVLTETIEDMRPKDCGMIDESWFIAQCLDGRWVAMSDAASQAPSFFDSEEEARQSWDDAADAERSIRT